MRKKEQITEIEITALSKKGHGTGKSDERTVEVPFTMPGDTVCASLLRKRRGLTQSRLLEIIKPSADRIAPRCAHAGECGGCRWQHHPYAYQLKTKQDSVAKAFEGLLPKDVQIAPILACEEPWHYRNKMEFTFSTDRQKERYLGLIINASKGRVLNLQECHLTNSWFIDALKAVREWWQKSDLEAYHGYRDTGALRTLTLREGMRTGDRMAMLTVSGNADYALKRSEIDSFVQCLQNSVTPEGANLSIFLRIQQIAKGSPTQFFEMHLAGPDHIREILHVGEETFEFHVSPTAFFQPNTLQAERLYAHALQLAQIPPDAIVYDLYCGTGTLGICAARHAKQVVGVEISPEAILDARTNAALNGMENVTFLAGAVHDILKAIETEKRYPKPDVVMVDPPRAGLDPVSIEHLVKFSPKKILYISCNPTTQAENIAELAQKGYRVTAMQPVDQFPHTVHIENIAVLEKG